MVLEYDTGRRKEWPNIASKMIHYSFEEQKDHPLLAGRSVVS